MPLLMVIVGAVADGLGTAVYVAPAGRFNTCQLTAPSKLPLSVMVTGRTTEPVAMDSDSLVAVMLNRSVPTG